MNIPSEAYTALKMLNRAGFEAYLVGGCVRDSIMNRQIGDIDITTSAKPQEVRQVFADYRVIETGLKHGTVTVVINHLHMEITTYRTEGGYSDGRHPDSVEFTASLQEDCARRDFTINAICSDAADNTVDFYGGIDDIENRLIRCVGDPVRRFSEDALRILRAVRFASVLDFDIEENTEKAIYECRYMLEKVSAERIYTELQKLLCGRNVKKILLEYTDVLAVFMPEIMCLKGFEQHNHHHIYDVLEHIAVAVENSPPIPRLRMAALLHDFGKPHTFTMDENGVGHFYGHGEESFDIAKKILRRLKVSNEEYTLISNLVRYHDILIEPSEKAVRRALNRYGEDTLRTLIQLKRADNRGQNIRDFDRTAEYDRLEQVLDKVIQRQQCFSLKQLAVNGRDLSENGIPPSKITGEILNMLLDMVINGEAENDRNVLLEKAAVIYNGKKPVT